MRRGLVKSGVAIGGLGLALGGLVASGCGRGESHSQVPAAAVAAIPDPYPIEVTGSDFEWRLRYPGPDGELGTADDRAALRHPHVPERTEVQFHLKSTDYLYSFELPERKMKEIAVPDLTFGLRLATDAPMELELRGDQFCGFTHPQLSGRVIVESRQQFAEWINTLPLYH